MTQIPTLFNEEELSDWALNYCYKTKDDPEIRELITIPHDAFLYCYHIKDRPEIRDRITTGFSASLYCKHIRGDIEHIKKLSERIL